MAQHGVGVLLIEHVLPLDSVTPMQAQTREASECFKVNAADPSRHRALKMESARDRRRTAFVKEFGALGRAGARLDLDTMTWEAMKSYLRSGTEHGFSCDLARRSRKMLALPIDALACTSADRVADASLATVLLEDSLDVGDGRFPAFFRHERRRERADDNARLHRFPRSRAA